jgi:site-specific recombinase XerD
MDVGTAVRQFLAQRSVKCKANTLVSYQQNLADWLHWRETHGYSASLADVELAELRAYVAQLAERLKPRTVRNIHRTIKALWRWLDSEEDLLTPAQRRFFVAGRIALPRIVERERPAVTPEQVAALLAVCSEDTEEGRRNRAMILLLWESGLRVFELASMQQSDLDLAERQARVIGKGDKEAYVFFGSLTRSAIRRYLLVRRGGLAGPLFRGCASRNNGQALTPDAIRHCLKRLARLAGVELPKGATVHGFRHGCARELRRRGASKEEVRDILRHEDLKTTQHYLGLDIEAPRAAHRRLID